MPLLSIPKCRPLRAAQQKALLDEIELSGFSETRFAALPGMKDPSFAHWRCPGKSQRVAQLSLMVKNTEEITPWERRRIK